VTRLPARPFLLCLLFAMLGARGLLAQVPPQVAADQARASALEESRLSTQQPTTTNIAAKDSKSDLTKVVIADGDLLEVTVYGLDDMAQKVRVDSEGNISLELLGQAHVGGLTPSEAERLLSKTAIAQGILKDPHFSVFIKENVQGGVAVLGEVNKPGIYALEGTHRLLEAISAAGGVTNKAGSTVFITRHDSSAKVIKTQLAQKDEDPGENVEVYPGDTVMVSKAPLVYVVGEVQRPSGFVMENGEPITVLQAIALAQGTTKNAKLGSARIIRKSPDGQYHEIPLALGDMLKAKKPDLALQKEDIVFIPTSLTRSVMATTLQSAVQIAVGAAIYRP
jgi:polysaccharide export outer membrane protein